MSESIQRPTTPATTTSACATLDRRAARRDFLAGAAELYGRPIDADPDELDRLDDTQAVLLAFPWMSDAELLEALWALAASTPPS
jgi:hypothetical protein